MNPSPETIHVGIQALLGLAAVCVAATQIKSFLAVKPEPSATYETKEAAEQKAKEMRIRIADVEARQEVSRTTRESDRRAAHDEMIAMRNEVKEDIRAVQERVDLVAPQISAMQKQVGDDIRAVHGRIDNLPAQLVTLLKNTGFLK